MKKRNFNILVLTIIVLILNSSCSEQDGTKKAKNKTVQEDSVSFKKEDKKELSSELDSVTDTASVDINDTAKTHPPEFYDEYNEVIRYYEGYISKAYDRKTYEKYFEGNKKKLDSLIEEYEK